MVRRFYIQKAADKRWVIRDSITGHHIQGLIIVDGEYAPGDLEWKTKDGAVTALGLLAASLYEKNMKLMGVDEHPSAHQPPQAPSHGQVYSLDEWRERRG